jgi:hypothetical protein
MILVIDSRVFFTSVFISATLALAQSNPPRVTTKPFGEVISQAEDAATLHSKHTPPYHLKASIVETTNPQSDYRAEIEEFYQSEKNWHRAITAPGLSWTQEMRDGRLQEQYSGDYAPLWLRELLDGITDPLPQHEDLEGMQQPFRILEGSHSSSCMRNLPGDLQVCIEGEHGAFDSILSEPGGLEFHDYQPFHHQWIARRLISNPESGTTLQLTITKLSDLSDSLPSTKIVPNPVPLLNVQVAQAVDEAFLRSSVNFQWPLVRGGNTKGYVRLFLGIGPDGRVREVWPVASDNGEIEDFARQQIRNWQFTPYLLNGQPVSVSTHWTIPFETKIGVPLPELSDVEVRQLASHMVEPSFVQGTVKPGQQLRVRIAVNEQGKLTGVDNPDGLGQSFMAIYVAVSQWKFHPLIQDGKPQNFHAWLQFTAQ